MNELTVIGNGDDRRCNFAGKYNLYPDYGIAPTVLASWWGKVYPALVVIYD